MWVFDLFGLWGTVALALFSLGVVLWDRSHVERDRRMEADRRWRERRARQEAAREAARWADADAEDERRRRLLEDY